MSCDINLATKQAINLAISLANLAINLAIAIKASVHKVAILSLSCNKLTSGITLPTLNSKHKYSFSLVFVPFTR